MPKYIRLTQDVKCIHCDQWIKKGRQVVLIDDEEYDNEIDWQDGGAEAYCHINCIKQWHKECEQ